MDVINLQGSCESFNNLFSTNQLPSEEKDVFENKNCQRDSILNYSKLAYNLWIF